MMMIAELARLDPQSLFTNTRDRHHFLRLARRLGQRRGARVLAFRLSERWASLLVSGAERDLRHLVRLLQSGYGVWRYHQGDPMQWRIPVRVPLPHGRAAAAQIADVLHASGGGDPLRHRWSSLRDGLGLREAPWFDACWLKRREPRALYRAAGGRGGLPEGAVGRAIYEAPGAPAPPRWAIVLAAVEVSTGLPADTRSVRSLRARVAWEVGWPVDDLALQIGVQVPAVRRSLRRAPEAAVIRALRHLHDPRLRASLLADINRVRGPLPKDPQPMEPPWSRLQSCSPRPARSSPAA